MDYRPGASSGMLNKVLGGNQAAQQPPQQLGDFLRALSATLSPLGTFGAIDSYPITERDVALRELGLSRIDEGLEYLAVKP